MCFESRYRAGFTWSFFGLAAVMSLAFSAPAVTAPGTPAIQVEDAWIRWLPANLPAAGYATLTNIGDRPEVLIAASSPDYGEVSLHQSRNHGGSVEMVPVDRITVAAHSTLSFAVAGYHMMLMQPAKPLKPGDRVPITLRFAGGSSLTVDFEVRKPDAGTAGAEKSR
jgi:hypothetical protein